LIPCGLRLSLPTCFLAGKSARQGHFRNFQFARQNFSAKNLKRQTIFHFQMYKVNKKKCVGCGSCLGICPGATKIEKDGKAKIVDQKKLKKCGGEKVCPYQAIEEIKGRS